MTDYIALARECGADVYANANEVDFTLPQLAAFAARIAALSVAPAQAAQDREDAQRIADAGSMLSNIAFNWSQTPGYVLTKHDCEMLDKLRRAWDAARQAPQAPAAQPLTDLQISKMYAKWDKNAGASIADLIRLVEAHHGIAHSVEKKASQP